MEELQRKSDESFLDYAERLINGRKNKIYSISEIEVYQLLFDIGLSSSEARKRLYGISEMIDSLKEEGYESITEENMLKELEIKKQQLIKEKIKVQTEKLTLNQMLREEARFELLIERAIDAIKDNIKFNVPTNIIKNDIIDKSGILIFADSHYDKELEIKGLRGEILNKYSPEIFEQRMWTLFSETIRICNKEGFNNIVIMSMGDELEGMIRVSQLMNLKFGVVESAIRYSYFIAEWLNKLSEYLRIDFYSTQGNHTDLRLLTGKKGDFPHENMGRVIEVLVTEILKDNKNITIYKNEADKIYTNIQGYNILGIHGEEKNVMQSIRDYSFIYDEKIDYLITGHKHHANSINLGLSKGCIGVGSIIGIDDFSMDLKRISDPSATLAVFEEGKGKTIEYNIRL